MPGIYLHIPFCVQACHYCDFHFSTNLKNKSTMVDMICKEIVLQKDYLTEKNITSIYFGGGTPSLLKEEELDKLLNTIFKNFTIEKATEITLEANPDDLTKSRLAALKKSGINRLSIGIQSFDDAQLKFMNRAHNAFEATNSVRFAQDIGFDNISVDLIYGVPSPSHAIWEKDLENAISLNVQHVSSYCLTIEPATVFGRRKEKGLLKPENEDYNAQQFELLMQAMEENGFEQYEVSNFCKSGFYSKHNSSYWKGEKYLGVGPGAHSYNKFERQFNIQNNFQYITFLEKETIPFSKEILDQKMKANEYLMTGLRTIWGINLELLETQYGVNKDSVIKILEKYLKTEHLRIVNSTVTLTKKGFLIADKITADLFQD
jgi:oxygen-independent coproporphyrinogen-3 oxidase